MLQHIILYISVRVASFTFKSDLLIRYVSVGMTYNFGAKTISFLGGVSKSQLFFLTCLKHTPTTHKNIITVSRHRYALESSAVSQRRRSLSGYCTIEWSVQTPACTVRLLLQCTVCVCASIHTGILLLAYIAIERVFA